MKTFEELKEDLLERAKKHNACQDGYRMGLNAKSKQDLLKAITDNWYWVLSTSKMIDANYLEENFTEEELTEAGIYTRKEHTSNAKSFPFSRTGPRIRPDPFASSPAHHTGLGLIGVYLSGKLTLYFLYLFPDLGYLVFHGRQVIGCHH